MPKMKSHSGAKKRFKLTGKGKVKHRASNMNHILAKKSPGRKRRLGKDQYVSGADEDRMKKLLLAR